MPTLNTRVAGSCLRSSSIAARRFSGIVAKTPAEAAAVPGLLETDAARGDHLDFVIGNTGTIVFDDDVVAETGDTDPDTRQRPFRTEGRISPGRTPAGPDQPRSGLRISLAAPATLGLSYKAVQRPGKRRISATTRRRLSSVL